MAERDINTLNGYINTNNDRAGSENLTRFFAFNQNVYLDPDLTGFSFIFVTKPSLFLYPSKSSENNKYLAYLNMCTDPKFSMYLETENTNPNDVAILKQLSYFEYPTTSSLFLPIFTNAAKSFYPNDVTLDTADIYTTKEGYRFTMPTSTTASSAAGELNISVAETKNLDITKILSIWVNYIQNVTNGTFTANPDMIKQNMLDYTCSIYYFSLAPDGRTLKYWAKYTGCFPTTIPYSQQGYQKGGIEQSSFDVNFKYMFKEDMDPRILEDFNAVSLHIITPELANYDDIVDELTSESSTEYTSYGKTNSLLSKSLLFSGKYKSQVTDYSRDPIVYYEEEHNNSNYAGKIPGSYKLSFSEDSLNNTFAESIFGETEDFKYDSMVDK